MEDEQTYVSKLAVLEVQKFDLACINVPQYDLLNLFGYLEEIKFLHEEVLARSLLHIVYVEDILAVFIENSGKLKIYVQDQWVKSQEKFYGKEALLKRFYNKAVIEDLSLPERRISDYLKFHQQLKSTYSHAKSSDVFQKSFQLFNDIYIQMQYVKQAAVIDKFPTLTFRTIHLVNSFNVTMDNTAQNSFKIFCMDDIMVFVTTLGNQKIDKVEMVIRNDTISLNANLKDEKSFEMYEHLDKTHKRTYLLVANNNQVRNEWMRTLNRILYQQMVVVRERIRSSSDESTMG